MLAVEILEELDAAKAAFLGFSWGAMVGCWFAALNPERTIALALVEGGHFDFADLPDFRTDRALDEFVADAEASAARKGKGFGSHTPAVAGAMIYGLCSEPATASYARLAESRTPVLFLGASGNESAVEVERLSHLVPQTEIIQLPSSSHELLRDAPSDVARDVGEWLARLSTFEK
jgi:pimeloyl-ACP methyl ester carboxylesterase